MRGLSATCLAGLALLSEPVWAAQIVALELKAEGDAPVRLARSLNPLMLAELSRIEGMSVISQDDVKALLELEANKQQLGCTDTACMTQIAGSLGAELMTTAIITRLSGNWIVSMSLIGVSTAKVVRRSTGKASGDEASAEQAITSAVSDLFKEGLPSEAKGPASLSRRGFMAALAGYKRAIHTRGADVRTSRKRIILDLIQTELDYDVEPKLRALDLEIRRSSSELHTLLLTSKDAGELEFYLTGIDQYRVLNDDLQRVREIRTRSRERGTVATANSLRFEDPEPLDRPTPEDIAAYQKAVEPARVIVGEAIRAYDKKSLPAFQKLWLKEYAGNAESAFSSIADEEKSRKQKCELLPFHATPPNLYDSALDVMKDGRMVVFLRCYREGKIYDDDRVWLQKEGAGWKISSW
jgi:hypothetical protein